MDYSPPGSSVCAIFQATILQQVAISYPRGSSWPGIEPESLHLLHWQVDSLPPRHLGRPLRITYNLKTHWILTLLWKEESEVTQSCMTLCDPMDCSLPGSHPWDFPGKSNGVGWKNNLSWLLSDLSSGNLESVVIDTEWIPLWLWYIIILHFISPNKKIKWP